MRIFANFILVVLCGSRVTYPITNRRVSSPPQFEMRESYSSAILHCLNLVLLLLDQ